MKKWPVPGPVADMVLAREDGKCAVCGLPVTGGHLHHRAPRGMGGSGQVNTPENLVLLHVSCHLLHVEQRRERAYRNGWLIPRGVDPAGTPMLYMLDRWVWLTPDGKAVTCEKEMEERNND